MTTIRYLTGVTEGGVECSYEACESGSKLAHLTNIRISNGRNCWHMRHFQDPIRHLPHLGQLG